MENSDLSTRRQTSYPGPTSSWPRRRIVEHGRRITNIRDGRAVYTLTYDWLTCGHAIHAGDEDRKTARCPKCRVGNPADWAPADVA